MQKPKGEQIEEWCEGEVTRYWLSLLHKRLDDVFMMRAETFFPGEPQKTQEQKAMFLGEESALKDLIEALESKSLSEYEEEELSNEQVGNSPERRQDIN